MSGRPFVVEDCMHSGVGASSVGARLWGGWVVALGVACAPACMGAVSLEGRPCPCADGYSCCLATNQCVATSQLGACSAESSTGEGSPDVGAFAPDESAPVDAEAGVADGDAGVADAGWADADADVSSLEAAAAADSPSSEADSPEAGGSDGPAEDGGCEDSGSHHVGAWQPMALGPLAPRTNPLMVWAGDGQGNGKVFIWGGRNPGNGMQLADGAVYDPRVDTWTTVASAGAPASVVGQVAVWTGTRVLVWGGASSLQTPVQSYDPIANSWAAGATPSLQFTSAMFATWTGRKMLVLEFGQGALYDPSTDTWTIMNQMGAPCDNQEGTSVWTGTQWIVWGGEACNDPKSYLNTGAAYDPTTDTWTALPVDGAPSPRQGHGAVWTGSEMLIWGGIDESSSLLSDGGAYDPISRTWRPIVEPAGLAQVLAFVAVGFPNQMLLWGGLSDGTGVLTPQGAQYDLCSKQWWQLPTTGQPPPRQSTSAVWTGLEMIVWGGVEPTSQAGGTGGRFKP
mgnify:CR=1 FL=1